MSHMKTCHKLFLILCVICLPFICPAQSTLKVHIVNSKDKDSMFLLRQYELFERNNLIATVKPEHGSTTSHNLSYGNYRLEYTSIFGKKESINIQLTEEKLYKVKLDVAHIDYSLESYVPIIDRLQIGESYSIEINSLGCFHHSREKLLIKRTSKQYILKYKGKKRVLNENKLQAIRNFEFELNYMDTKGCTTEDTYHLKYKDHELNITDGSCSWNGDIYLKKGLGIN